MVEQQVNEKVRKDDNRVVDEQNAPIGQSVPVKVPIGYLVEEIHIKFYFWAAKL
jgi:hypothetical protein